MPRKPAPKPPAGLAATGRALWREIHKAVAEDLELDERELAILALACRQADDVATLEAALKSDGAIVRGSQGQPRLNAVVTELRQGRLAVSRLLGELELPAADDAPRSASSKRAQHAATARWAEHAARRAMRNGA